MRKRQQANWVFCVSLWLTMSALPAACLSAVAQTTDTFALDASITKKEQPAPVKASQPAAFSIPVEQFGFSAPGLLYLGERYSFASLDFIDENRLLFTFRVPGLIHREAGSENGNGERRIRAMVLLLPTGTVEAETLWTLHDPWRYLWMLKDGHFLLRDRDGLQQGDATLALKPFLRFPGALLWLDMDPAQQFLVAGTHEPAPATKQPEDFSSSEAEDPETALSLAYRQKIAPQPDDMLRILHSDTGQVMLASRIRSAVRLPINSEGYVESLRENGLRWQLNLHSFNGGIQRLAQVESSCPPAYNFIAEQLLLATTCTALGKPKLVAIGAGGRHLWEASPSAASIWPLVTHSQDGSRLGRETLDLNYPVGGATSISTQDVQGQSVEIFDAMTGNIALKLPVSPVLDAGGNLALSPSGRRVAVIYGGTIQIYELPAALSIGSAPLR